MKPILLQPANLPPHRLDWALGRLREFQVRLTPVRELVLRHLANHPAPVTLNEISASEELAGQFDDATVYRTLVLLVELEVARQLHFRDRATCFVLNLPGECFSFLVCRCCGTLTSLLHSESLRALEEEISALHGYQSLKHELELSGICPRCQQHTQSCVKPSKLLPGLRLRGRANN